MPTTGGALSKPKKPTKLKSLNPPKIDYSGGGGGVTANDILGQRGDVVLPGGARKPVDQSRRITGFQPDSTTVTSAGTGVGMTPVTGIGLGGATGGAMPGGYTPLGYGEFWNNPDALAQDFYSRMGIDNPEMSGIMGDAVDAARALEFLLNGNPDLSSQAGFMDDYMTQINTPGGNALNVSAIMSEFANADPHSPAGQFLAQATPQEVEAFAMQLLSASGANPYYQRGYDAQLQQSNRDYTIDKAKGATGEASTSYYDQLKTGPYAKYYGGR